MSSQAPIVVLALVSIAGLLYLGSKPRHRKEYFRPYGWRGQSCQCSGHGDARLCTCRNHPNFYEDWELTPPLVKCQKCLRQNALCANGLVRCRDCSNECSDWVW